MKMNVGFISLGCSKNLVDTEMTIGLFKKNNYKIVNKPEDADILVINTCGFLVSAREEAINTILEMALYKEQRCKYLIVMGCMVENNKEELIEALPEVDLFIKFSEYDTIWEQIESIIGKDEENKNARELAFCDRVITTGEDTAYLRIAEGCNNRCSYCAIPGIRGNYVSRTIEDIVEEAEKLAKSGIKELIIIAQDTTKYGIDIYKEKKLKEVLQKVSEIEGIEWIRFLYAYPESITDDLIDIVKNNDKIIKYFDIPIQHINNNVLKNMNRQSTSEKIRELIVKLRKEIPNVILRTTVMVGFPGETEEEFEELCEFVKWARFDKLGAFAFSKEEGTRAYDFLNQIDEEVKNERYNKIMEIQKQVSEETLKQKVGLEVEMLVETQTFDGQYYVGRTVMDVPDIDGLAYLPMDEENLLGKIIKVKIIDVNEYDYVVERIK